MRTISALIFEYGMNMSIFCACAALRMRASRSAMGSVTVLMKSSGWLRGGFPGPVAERHSHFAQERFGFLVRPRGRDDSNIKSDVALDFIELDLGKNRLIGNAERVVAMSVEAARRHSAKIADARQGRLNKALEKFIHPLTAQRHLRRNRLVFAQFE